MAKAERSLIPEDHGLVKPAEVLPPTTQLPAVVDRTANEGVHDVVPSEMAPSNPVHDADVVDLRSNLMALANPQQIVAVADDYYARRKTLREWIKSKLVEGVHYGYPPKLKPKFNDDGQMIVKQWNKKLKGGQGDYETLLVDPESWTAKPSLYKAGADFVCDLMLVRDQYEADMAAWEQMGKPKDLFVFACRLYSRKTSELVGEGRGCRKVGSKGGDENNAIKMAKKCAKVDAVLNAYGLADLFTQDIEDMKEPPPEYDPPDRTEGAPTASTRQERKAAPSVTGDEMGQLCRAWKSFMQLDSFNAGEFVSWVRKKLDPAPLLDPTDTKSWPAKLTRAQFDALLKEIP